jgi:hypothetical protein
MCLKDSPFSDQFAARRLFNYTGNAVLGKTLKPADFCGKSEAGKSWISKGFQTANRQVVGSLARQSPWPNNPAVCPDFPLHLRHPVFMLDKNLPLTRL